MHAFFNAYIDMIKKNFSKQNDKEEQMLFYVDFIFIKSLFLIRSFMSNNGLSTN